MDYELGLKVQCNRERERKSFFPVSPIYPFTRSEDWKFNEYQQQQQKKQLLQLTIIHQLNNSATMAYAKHGGSICGGTAIVSPYLGAQTNADCYERLSSASKHDYSRTAYRGNYDERGRMLQKRRISTETPLQHNSSSSKANGSRAKKIQ
ncbi:unnamed protein product [Ceratitis capitata]|uniref:(Mediterranean fruit fly) hypothetical protein n=1 Tax=Ceratitis capitata TaxID=7213 RepID=A0A811U4D9_CERCA|nr:unnamed protein product [Ceratitis capitata]